VTAGIDAVELRAKRADRTAVVSLYLNIPVDLADHRGLIPKARDLIRSAGGDQAAEDTEAITTAMAGGAQEWLGRTMAFFACAEIGLLEIISLPGSSPDRAVVAAKPCIRPLLAAVQRNPPYQVAVIDTKHAWLFGVAGDEIDTLAERTGREVPSTRFAGWYGLEAYRIEQRIMELSRQHFRDTIGVLAEQTDVPLVLGGHEMQLSQFTAMLPASVRQRVAGSFSVDLQTATPGRVRELSAPVIDGWARAREAQLVSDVLAEAPGKAVTTNLEQCRNAVRSRAVSQLVLADACEDYLLDELTSQALDGGSEVTAVREAPFAAAARLRFQPAPA